MTRCVVITTIMPPSGSVVDHCRRGMDAGVEVVIAADRRTPVREYDRLAGDFPNLHVLTLERQHELFPRLARTLPSDHYARKNLGYAFAISRGHESIFDTDDDNLYRGDWDFPQPCPMPLRVRNRGAGSEEMIAFFNVYSLYTQAHIWPRGFPLEAVRNPDANCDVGEPDTAEPVALWQGLVDGDPDVDAIARLTCRDAGTDIQFDPVRRRVVLDAGVLCPLNAQNLWWVDRSAFPLMFLPGTVNSRVSDIMRGYVAQHCLWKRGARVGFSEPTAFQARNPHNLLADFEAEIPLYLHAARMNLILSAAADRFCGTSADLRLAYSALAEHGFVRADEVESVDAWIEAISER